MSFLRIKTTVAFTTGLSTSLNTPITQLENNLGEVSQATMATKDGRVLLLSLCVDMNN